MRWMWLGGFLNAHDEVPVTQNKNYVQIIYHHLVSVSVRLTVCVHVGMFMLGLCLLLTCKYECNFKYMYTCMYIFSMYCRLYVCKHA